MEYIKWLRNMNSLTQEALAKKLGIAQNTLSNWENGNRSPDNQSLVSIAKMFSVSVDTLLHENHNRGFCPECGMNYIYDNQEDVSIHNRKHHRWQKAVKQYGFCWPYYIREEIKQFGRNGMKDGTLSLDEKVACCVLVYKALFSRSVEGSDFDLRHVDFSTYSAMLLNQENQRNLMPANVYEAMVEQYEKMEGIANGKSYYLVRGGKPKNKCSELEMSTITIHIMDPTGEIYNRSLSDQQASIVKSVLDQFR